MGDRLTYALVVGDGQMAMTNECGHEITLFHQENMKVCFAISSTGLSRDLPSVNSFLCDCPEEACCRQLYNDNIMVNFRIQNIHLPLATYVLCI